MSLVSNTYGNYLLDSAMRAVEFDLLSRVVERVPVRHVTFAHDIEQLRDSCATTCAARDAGANGRTGMSSEGNKPPKRPYSTPRLVTYGDITRLTQSSTLLLRKADGGGKLKTKTR